jgi:hypothetical protein
LALQSASKKWQQKEQQVMKESKEKLTKTKTVQQKIKTSSKTHSAKKVSTTGYYFCYILLIEFIYHLQCLEF